MEVYNVFCIYLLYLLLNQGRTAGVCSRLESASTNGRSFYFKKTFCCDNYEMKEDKTCKACKIGFKSKAGLGCTACIGETYGLKCAEKCECNLLKAFVKKTLVASPFWLLFMCCVLMYRNTL